MKLVTGNRIPKQRNAGKHRRTAKRLGCLLVLAAGLLSSPIFSDDLPVVYLVNDINDELEGDLKTFQAGYRGGGEGRDMRILITSVSVSDDFDSGLRKYTIDTLKEIQLGQNEHDRLYECLECTTYRAESDGRDIYLKKGIVSKDELNSYLRRYGADLYATVTLLYSGVTFIYKISIFNGDDDRLLWSNTYRKRVLHLKKTGLTLELKTYQAVSFSPSGFPLGATVAGGERIWGLGSVGLQTGTSFGSETVGDYYYAGPYFHFNLNQIFGSFTNWGSYKLTAAFQYGFYNGARDISLNAGIRLDFGSLFFATLEYTRGIAITQDSAQAFPSSLLLGFGVSVF